MKLSMVVESRPDGTVDVEMRGEDITAEQIAGIFQVLVAKVAPEVNLTVDALWEMVDRERACPTVTFSNLKVN